MRDYRRIRRRIDISLDRRQFFSALGGLTVGAGLLFSLGLVIGRNTAAPGAARLEALPDETTAVKPLLVGSSEEENTEKKQKPIEPRQGQHKPDINIRGHRNPDKPRAVSSNQSVEQAPEFYEQDPIKSGMWVIQFSAHETLAEAKNKVAKLSNYNFESQQLYIVKANINNKTWYRVRAGGYGQNFDAINNMMNKGSNTQGAQVLMIK